MVPGTVTPGSFSQLGVNRLIKNDLGFFLLETVIAIFILAVVSVSFFGLYCASVSGAARAARYSVAAHLAREKMEEVRGAGYCCAVSEDAAEVPGYPEYLRSVAVAPVQGAEELALWQVTVTVTWPAGGPAEAEYCLISCLGRR